MVVHPPSLPLSILFRCLVLLFNSPANSLPASFFMIFCLLYHLCPYLLLLCSCCCSLNVYALSLCLTVPPTYIFLPFHYKLSNILSSSPCPCTCHSRVSFHVYLFIRLRCCQFFILLIMSFNLVFLRPFIIIMLKCNIMSFSRQQSRLFIHPFVFLAISHRFHYVICFSIFSPLRNYKVFLNIHRPRDNLLVYLFILGSLYYRLQTP